MMKCHPISISFLSLFLFCFCLSCSSDEELLINSRPILYDNSIEYSLFNDSLGRINAVKKARQLTDINFTPLKQVEGWGKSYIEGKSYQGMIYSMVSEMGNYIGDYVSFHTFMTALYNPKSKLYTEDVGSPPYHGYNCRAYYGTVCSMFASYALGIFPGFSTRDFIESDLITEINIENIDSIKIADILWVYGHVALITDILKDGNEHLVELEISESVPTGCRRYKVSRNDFLELMELSFDKILRYKELYRNLNYTPVPEFVAVLDEAPLSFQFNNDLCVDKGDKSCYLENDTIIVNTMHDYDFMEIFKGDELYKVISEMDKDVTLCGLPYGDYKARVYYNGIYSDFTYWKVVNIFLKVDKSKNRLYFHSENAKPVYVTFRDIAGLMQPKPTHNCCFYIFEDADIHNGYVSIDKINTCREYPYIRVFFSTDYGMIINNPISINDFN